MHNNLINIYKKQINRKRKIILSLVIISILLAILSISVGSSMMSFIDVIKAIFRIGDNNNILIVYNIRLPRVIAAIIAGGGLAISGCVMQNVLKNDMASPSTLGVGNASVFGANVAIILLGAGSMANSNGFIDINNPYIVSTFSFLFAIICLFIILFLAKIKKFKSTSIILAGVALSTIFSAGTTLLQFFSVDNQLSSAIYWTFGNLGRATYKECLIMFIIITLSFIYFLFKRWDFNALSNGQDLASSLGVKVNKVTLISLLLSSLITAVCVSFLGVIGFVGLIAPQIMKKIIGDDFRFLIPSSFLFGVCLLLLSDTIGRVILLGTALPVGAITSLLGGPMFIYLLLRKKDDE